MHMISVTLSAGNIIMTPQTQDLRLTPLALTANIGPMRYHTRPFRLMYIMQSITIHKGHLISLFAKPSEAVRVWYATICFVD